MKKTFAVLLLLISVTVFVMHVTVGNEEQYSRLCISREKMQEIVESRKEAKDVLYTAILFNGYELTSDVSGNRLFYSLIEDSDNAYNPYVECVSKENAQIAIVGDLFTEETITNGTEYGILIYTDEEYQFRNLVFTTLPLLELEYEGVLNDVDMVSLKFSLFDNRRHATQRVVSSEGDIKLRGRSSINFPKQGYRFTLYSDSVGEHRREFNTALLGMRQDGDWLLYAAYNDKEKVRNIFSSNLWKLSCATNNFLGIDNGMEYRYVELFINGEYWGLYALGYPIDQKQLHLTDGEYMYKKENPELSELAIDFTAEGAVEGYSIKEIGTNQVESWEPLKKYYCAMLGEDKTYSELREWVDIQNSMDIFLFLNLIQGVDHANVRGNNLIFNLYMTNKFSADGQSEVMLYTPWDMDRTWGLGFEEEGDVVTPNRNVLMQTNIVYLLLEQGDEEMKELLVERYQELREGVWSDESIMMLLNGYEDDIFYSGAYARERIRWPMGSYIDTETKLSAFKAYVLERLRYMDEYVQNGFS